MGIQGNVVKTEKVNLSTTVSINTSGLKTGVYLLKIESENGLHTAKLIIE
ncbi:MAG: T9SS type A sorting domain-containing protein [Marinirhabdus sp.]